MRSLPPFLRPTRSWLSLCHFFQAPVTWILWVTCMWQLTHVNIKIYKSMGMDNSKWKIFWKIKEKCSDWLWERHQTPNFTWRHSISDHIRLEQVWFRLHPLWGDLWAPQIMGRFEIRCEDFMLSRKMEINNGRWSFQYRDRGWVCANWGRITRDSLCPPQDPLLCQWSPRRLRGNRPQTDPKSLTRQNQDN